MVCITGSCNPPMITSTMRAASQSSMGLFEGSVAASMWRVAPSAPPLSPHQPPQTSGTPESNRDVLPWAPPSPLIRPGGQYPTRSGHKAQGPPVPRLAPSVPPSAPQWLGRPSSSGSSCSPLPRGPAATAAAAIATAVGAFRKAPRGGGSWMTASLFPFCGSHRPTPVPMDWTVPSRFVRSVKLRLDLPNPPPPLPTGDPEESLRQRRPRGRPRRRERQWPGQRLRRRERPRPSAGPAHRGDRIWDAPGDAPFGALVFEGIQSSSLQRRVWGVRGFFTF